MTNPENNHAPAVSYRIGTGGLTAIPPEGLDDELLYALKTITGVEWFDANGKWTDSPPFRS